LPPEDPNGQICALTRTYKPFYFFVSSSIFFISLVIFLVIYAVIFSKFRKSRKKLEALQRSNEEDYTTSNLSFHHRIGIFKKKLVVDIRGLPIKQIQALGIRGLDCGLQAKPELTIIGQKRKRKRRSSSVLKNLTFLASHIRAAKYILVIVSTLICTWMPFIIFSFYDSLQYESSLDAISDMDIAMIFSCMQTALQSKHCNVSMVIGDVQEIQEVVRNLFHFEESVLIDDIIGFDLSLLNSMANPILYAMWYPEFRMYFLQISVWFNT
jgi:hypothetical protein